MGRFDADGDLQIVGRLKDMIITGGENVYAAEVERALLAVHGVAEVVVIGVPEKKWGESVAAWFVAKNRIATDTGSRCGSIPKPDRLLQVPASLRLRPHAASKCGWQGAEAARGVAGPCARRLTAHRALPSEGQDLDPLFSVLLKKPMTSTLNLA